MITCFPYCHLPIYILTLRYLITTGNLENEKPDYVINWIIIAVAVQGGSYIWRRPAWFRQAKGSALKGP
jgi:hypothetical protein